MAKTINVPSGTKLAHAKFIEWLNEMLNDYVSSFYDDAAKNIIRLAFIRIHSSFLQELYQADGRVLSGFMTILPTDTSNFIMMVHDLGNGRPFLYNKTDGVDLFDFDATGRLVKFYENITINLYKADGSIGAECYIVFEDWYGVKAPMYYIKEIGTNSLIGKGFVDLVYENKYSGCYMVRNTPIDEYPKFKITNTTLVKMVMDVPLLKDLNIRYSINAGTAVWIPITEWSDYFFREGKKLDGVKIERI